MEIAIGCSNGVLSKAIKHGTDISAIWISKIIETYKIYDPGWLLTGIGEMLKPKSNDYPVQLNHLEGDIATQLLQTKNELIDSLKQQIEIQLQFIEKLKESSSPLPSEQKRKAG